jgi:hypothetical protein
MTLTRAPATTYWCLAEPGRVYAVYVRGLDEPVTLDAADSGDWTVVRYDPRDGTTDTIEPTINGARVQLAPPDDLDWLFVVRRRR